MVIIGGGGVTRISCRGRDAYTTDCQLSATAGRRSANEPSTGRGRRQVCSTRRRRNARRVHADANARAGSVHRDDERRNYILRLARASHRRSKRNSGGPPRFIGPLPGRRTAAARVLSYTRSRARLPK